MLRPNAPGWLIVLEGIDGAGKSTILRQLAQHSIERGFQTVTSAEPTRGTWGMKLRESMAKGRLSLSDELTFFIKDRAQHVQEIIRPALAERKVVILDRYYLSTAAYQGARGASPDMILSENERFAPAPDLVLLLDFAPEEGLQRIHARGHSPDTFEDITQLREVRKIFLSIQRDFIRRIDASTPPEAVWKQCRQEFDALIKPSETHPSSSC